MKRYSLIAFLFIALSLGVSSCDEGLIIDDQTTYGDYLMIVPDIQEYMDNPDYFKYLDAITSYYNNNREDIKYCFQVGDITNNNREDQWATARDQFFSKFPEDSKPIFCLGNHDYGDNGTSNLRTSNIPADLLPERESYMSEEGLENYIRHISLGGRHYAVLVLEFAPRNETLEWVDKVLKEDPATPYIILTHAFLNNYGQLFDASDPNCDQVYSQKNYWMGGGYHNDSKEIFDKVIYNNTNVEMVICGHCLSSNYIEYLAVPNVSGKNVHCIMVDYQHCAEGGQGFVGLLYSSYNEFELYSYSTFQNKRNNLIASFYIK